MRLDKPIYSTSEAMVELGIKSRNTFKALRAHWGVEGVDWWTVNALNRMGGVEYQFSAATVQRLREIRRVKAPALLDPMQGRNVREVTEIIMRRHGLSKA